MDLFTLLGLGALGTIIFSWIGVCFIVPFLYFAWGKIKYILLLIIVLPWLYLMTDSIIATLVLFFFGALFVTFVLVSLMWLIGSLFTLNKPYNEEMSYVNFVERSFRQIGEKIDADLDKKE